MAVKGLHLNGNRVAGTGSMSGNQSTLNPKKDLASWWNGFKNRKAAKNEEDSKSKVPRSSL